MRSGPLADVVDAVGAGYAFVQAYTGKARGPEHADAVGRTQVRRCQYLGEGGIAARGHDEFRVDGADLAGERREVRGGIFSGFGVRSRLFDPDANAIKSLLEIDAVDAHAQNL